MKLLDVEGRKPTVEQTCVLLCGYLWMCSEGSSFSTLVRASVQRNVGPSETGNEVHRGGWVKRARMCILTPPLDFSRSLSLSPV